MFYLFHTHDSLEVSRVWRKLVVHYEAVRQCNNQVLLQSLYKTTA